MVRCEDMIRSSDTAWCEGVIRNVACQDVLALFFYSMRHLGMTWRENWCDLRSLGMNGMSWRDEALKRKAKNSKVVMWEGCNR